MHMSKPIRYALFRSMIATGTLLGVLAASAAVSPPNAPQMPAPQMSQLIEQFSADSGSLERAYPVAISPVRIARFQKFYTDEQAMLETIDFDAIPHQDQVDYLLLKNLLSTDLHQLALQKRSDDPRDA